MSKQIISNGKADLIVDFNGKAELYEINLMKHNLFFKVCSSDLGQMLCTKADIEQVIDDLENGRDTVIKCNCCATCTLLCFFVNEFDDGDTYIERYILGSCRKNLTRRMSHEFYTKTETYIEFFKNCIKVFEK